jgi:hypothetical protein
MEDTESRPPGRPTLYDERLERIQMLVTRDMHDEAKREAKKRGVSVSTIYREWIEKGRKRR